MFAARQWRWPNPLQIAFAGLVGFNGLTICGALLFGYMFVARTEREAEVGHYSLAFLDRLVALDRAAILLGAPVNDVLENRDAEGERRRFEQALAGIYHQLALAEVVKYSNIPEVAALAEAADIDAIRAAVEDVAANSGPVFRNVERGRLNEAAHRMAVADQAARRLTQLISVAEQRYQRMRFHARTAELNSARMTQQTGWIAALAALILVVATAAYGSAVSRAMSRKSTQIKQYSAELEAERAQLELRVGERTEALRRAMADAQEANAAKSRFIANMSHELRTPLWSIQAYAEMLREGAQDGGRADEIEDIEKIVSASRHLLALVNEVLDISKIEAGRVRIDPTDYDPVEAISSVVQIVRPLAVQNGNSLSVNVARGLRCAHNDAQKIRQCMLNLAGNAAKFTKGGLVVIQAGVTVRDGRSWLRFEVRDTGIGIRAEKMQNLFQPFVQGEESTTREYGGTGLGLAITKQLVELMGGVIGVESAEGEGSVFWFEVPLDLRQAEMRIAEQCAGEAA